MGDLPEKRSSDAEIASFVQQLAAGRGRLIFALDATASREPNWDRASRLQAEMFQVAESLGGLDVQLVYFRGFGECKASAWLSEAGALSRLMARVSCRAGRTQIGRVLGHALSQTRKERVHALVYVGDCVEEEADHLADMAGRLGLFGVPVFLFQEGTDPRARRVFQEIAHLTRGAWCSFDPSSADQLRALLRAVAVYASGGREALIALGARQGGVVLQISRQMEGR